VDDLLVLDVFGRATVPDGTADAEPEDLAPALEALCFALGREVSIVEAAATLDRSPAAVTRAAGVLAAELRGRGLMLQRSADSVQLVTRPEMAWAVQRALHPARPSRLSRAAMETLAIVAYRQPATKAVIESIRGVDCEAVLEHLTERGLVDEIGRQETPGHPRLFGTTLRFLQLVGLERIEDLPPVAEPAALPSFE
jgi:segregation and condensation protein B